MTTNKTLRKVFVVTMALVMVMAMSVSAFADSKISMKKAFSIALENAKLTSDEVRRVEKEWDDGAYSIEFTKKGSRTEYEYEISASGKILEKSVDYNRAKVYGKKKLTKSEAIAKVAKFSGFKKSVVKNGYIDLEKEDGEWVYEITFERKGYEYNYDVHARTGKILEYSKESFN